MCALSLHCLTQSLPTRTDVIAAGAHRLCASGPVRRLAARPRVAAGARVHGLPPPADGGGGRARERGAGLGGAQLAAGPLVAGQGDVGYGTVPYSELVLLLGYYSIPRPPTEY